MKNKTLTATIEIENKIKSVFENITNITYMFDFKYASKYNQILLS